MTQNYRKDRRRHCRQQMHEPVVLSWQQAGTNAYARGHCTNISETGFCVDVTNCYRPLPSRALVLFRIESLDLSGSAVVRHSATRQGKVVAGLEFAGGMKWNPSAKPLMAYA